MQPSEDSETRMRAKSTDNPEQSLKRVSIKPSKLEITNIHSSMRREYTAKFSSHALKYNFNKKRITPQLDTDENSNDWLDSESELTQEIDTTESSIPQEQNRAKKSESDQAPTEEIWERNFDAYKKLVETKIDSIYHFHVKEVISSTAHAQSSSLQEYKNQESEHKLNSNSKAEAILVSENGLSNSDSEYLTFNSRETQLVHKTYVINVFPPINEEGNESENSQDKIETPVDTTIKGDNVGQNKSRVQYNVMESPKLQSVSDRKHFEFLAEEFDNLDNNGYQSSYRDWKEFEKLGLETLEENKSALDMFYVGLRCKILHWLQARCLQ